MLCQPASKGLTKISLPVEMLFILQCTDSVSDSQLSTLQYNFRHIADLENVEPNQLVGKSSILLL